MTVRNVDGSFAVATGLFGYVRVLLDFSSERIAVGTKPVAVIAEDTNGDGGPEIITANDGSSDVSVLAASNLRLRAAMGKALALLGACSTLN